MPKRIEELKIVIDAIEKLVKQQPFTYVFLRFTLRVLRFRVKTESTRVKNQKKYKK